MMIKYDLARSKAEENVYDAVHFSSESKKTDYHVYLKKGYASMRIDKYMKHFASGTSHWYSRKQKLWKTSICGKNTNIKGQNGSKGNDHSYKN